MSKLYVHYGCGFSVGKDWLNFDGSPTLRMERLPVIGALLGRMSGNPNRFPRAARYGNICRGLLVKDGSAQGVYASHILEHLSYEDFRLALKNTFRLLKPGGTFRLIVPDLQERARRYLESAARRDADASGVFMKTCYLGLERRPKSPVGRIKLLLGGSAHLWMWDEPSMARQLEEAGFTCIRRCEFGDAADTMFAQVENEGRFVDQELNLKELAIEAFRP